MGVLDNKLKSASSRMLLMKENLNSAQKSEEMLDELNKRLHAAEDRIRGKDQQLNLLREQLDIKAVAAITDNTMANFMSSPYHLRQGWLNKKGNIIPIWSQRYCAISGVDHRLYYSKSQEDKYLGFIVLHGAFVQEDTMKKSGKDHCFMVLAEAEKHTYYFAAASKEDMDEWMGLIQERIIYLNFVKE